MRLLIAEDEAIIRMDMKEMLQALGHSVVAEARTGSEAVTLATACLPDCVLMDAHMDGDDGFDAARAITNTRICPVVMITAYAQAEKMREASEAGVFAYVTKPFAEKDLVAAIEVATSRFDEARHLYTEIEQMKDRIESRKLIDKAKFYLVSTGVTEEEAFARMRKASMDARKPLREIAEAIILSHQVIN